MMQRLCLLSLCIATFLSSGVSKGFAQVTAQPLRFEEIQQAPYNTTGIIFSKNDLATRSGSGAVVRHPKIVLSCAHVVFNRETADTFPWNSDNSWYRGTYDTFPDVRESKSLRGFYVVSSYADYAMRYQVNGARTFANDFVTYFSYEDLAGGSFAGYWPTGTQALQTKNPKMILGYPIGLYADGDARRFLMHRTGPFENILQPQFQNYLTAYGVSAGPGNSGGPIYVGQGSQFFFAGIYVSGLEKQLGDGADVVGVYGMSPPAWEIVSQAISQTDLGSKQGAPGIGAQLPKLEIRGRNQQIANYDNTPRFADDTNFGTASGERQTLTRSFSIMNKGSVALELNDTIQILPLNSERVRFRIVKQPPQRLEAGKKATFAVRFLRSANGKFKALVRVQSNDPLSEDFLFRVAAERTSGAR